MIDYVFLHIVLESYGSPLRWFTCIESNSATFVN
jgi:hypothetical protein